MDPKRISNKCLIWLTRIHEHLGTNLNTSIHMVTNRMISTMMTKLHLKSPTAQCLANQLVAHTNSKDWNLPNYFLNCLNGIRNGSWITRTITEKNTIRLQIQSLRSRPSRRNNCNSASICCQAPQNIMLDSKIICNNLVQSYFKGISF